MMSAPTSRGSAAMVWTRAIISRAINPPGPAALVPGATVESAASRSMLR